MNLIKLINISIFFTLNLIVFKVVQDIHILNSLTSSSLIRLSMADNKIILLLYLDLHTEI